MNRFFLYAIPILTLAIFIVIMTGGFWLKQPFGEQDRVFESFQKLEDYTKGEEWEKAQEEVDYTAKAWKKVVNRIQFSAEREYMLDIAGVIAKIEGSIRIQDKEAIIQEIYYFYSLWENLGR
ncbi:MULTISPECIES: DUF4363 family protein [Pontibacillus]|uniref:DUF4363 family protein n=1 Tax=Pontibacillus chungwhensis TaxID=265426 RepID=A0ABY8UXA5_9BACI|nr:MULTISPECIES: DUF4363 family protein [Pontibacillus]MCD5322868.1 DUF4363 family protein [Pontibacillus sp. HN14]WIF96266.1 DUF4363 family protein [Pontibacillus chungwhensis]